MRIAFLISTLGTGGAERTAAQLCNYFVKSGHEVTLVTNQSPTDPIEQNLHPDIDVHCLDAASSENGNTSFLFRNFKRVTAVRKHLVKFDPSVVICFMTETNTVGIIASSGTSWPVIISERTYPAKHKISTLFGILRRATYPHASCMVVQNAEFADWYNQRMTKLRTEVIPNPIDFSQFSAMQCSENTQDSPSLPHRVMAMGRLGSEKGFDVLINAFGAIAHRNPDWELVIYGEGAERQNLENLIRTKGLESRIRLPGKTDNPAQQLANADIFVLSSRYEGFPNVLLEALASNLCVVATDCSPSVHEILQQGEFGLVCETENETDLQRQLSKAIEDPELRAQYSSSARNAVARYDIDRVGAVWTQLIGELAE